MKYQNALSITNSFRWEGLSDAFRQECAQRWADGTLRGFINEDGNLEFPCSRGLNVGAGLTPSQMRRVLRDNPGVVLEDDRLYAMDLVAA